MIPTDHNLTPSALHGAINHVFDSATTKILSLNRRWDPSHGSPVFTVRGEYSTRGWTEWTQGFQFGSALLVFAATGDESMLVLGRAGTLAHMPRHLTHIGVHDHGFNNVSTYGTLYHLGLAGRLPRDPDLERTCALALKVSGAIQAARWTRLSDDEGYIYSFNGPHSLFADTIRSLRSLALAHSLGHVLMGERDQRISLLERLLVHAETTARYNVFFGAGRDAYDVRGRVAHESIFNTKDGAHRCSSSQQGYSPFTTWTRGLAWILCGYAEQLEFLQTLPADDFGSENTKEVVLARFVEVAQATADFYIASTPTDGIPYWDTGAPGLARLGDYLDRPADPFNEHEPVDSSAAAIAAQGLIRLGCHLLAHHPTDDGQRYLNAGLVVARTVFGEPYLSLDPDHDGLLLHAVYHRPNGWDHVPPGRRVPCGEACMWGDYHLLELALLIQQMAGHEGYYTFFGFHPRHAAP